MLIGELSTKTGVSRDTIRYYEKMGLLRKKDLKRRNNNYKEYTTDAVERIKLIKIGKDLGFKLGETIEFLGYWESGNTDDPRLTEMVQNKIKEIDRKIKELKSFRKNLVQALVKCDPE